VHNYGTGEKAEAGERGETRDNKKDKAIDGETDGHMRHTAAFICVKRASGFHIWHGRES